jgi:hypothetical protein
VEEDCRRRSVLAGLDGWEELLRRRGCCTLRGTLKEMLTGLGRWSWSWVVQYSVSKWRDMACDAAKRYFLGEIGYWYESAVFVVCFYPRCVSLEK